MRIMVTGGLGAIGRVVVARLVQSGYSVLVLDQQSGAPVEGVDFISCDINDFTLLRSTMQGCGAVVHLAAISNPILGASQDIFKVNCLGTFNVFQAAAEAGIRRIIQASSINATGQYFGLKPAPLYYLPLDEDHPLFATDSYSFSKHIIEEIGDYFWRREGISSLAFRFPNVVAAANRDDRLQGRRWIKKLVDQLLSQPFENRRAWFYTHWDVYNAFRLQRPYEIKGFMREYIDSLSEEKHIELLLMTHRVNFFSLLDERDAAQAVEKGLEASFEGSHALYINDSQNWTGIESSILASLFYPDVLEFKKDLVGTESLVSIERARQLIGFFPEYTFGEGI